MKKQEELTEAVLATLAYSDMFSYPLNRKEVQAFLGKPSQASQVAFVLDQLISSGLIFKFGEFYSLKEDPALVASRCKANIKAAKLIKVAGRIGNMLVWFPFVRAIGISGSLSKNFADENSDIDLFVITEKNRLWIARTFMHFFKKLTFLVGMQNYFCMNYYIDEEQLEIVEKNIYTAMEVSTMIPLQGERTFDSFYQRNTWTRDFLPNQGLRAACAKPLADSIIKRTLEQFFNNRLGDTLDTRLMKITASRWKKKTEQRKLNAHRIVMSMNAGKHYAKPDPLKFQTILLERYSKKVSGLLNNFEACLK